VRKKEFWGVDVGGESGLGGASRCRDGRGQNVLIGYLVSEEERKGMGKINIHARCTVSS